MAPNVHFKAGESINYNGKSAVVVSDPFGSRTLTISVDGKVITVDRNDLFGMNKDNPNLQDRIDACDEQIENNWDIINKAKALHAAAMDAIKSCRNQMYSILRAFHASSADEIDDLDQRREYLSLSSQRADAVMTRNNATHQICQAAIDTGSVCSTKMNLINQQALYDRLA